MPGHHRMSVKVENRGALVRRYVGTLLIAMIFPPSITTF